MNIKCAICYTPLESENEPCPNCMPSIAWRPPTIKPCAECKRLKIKLKELEIENLRLRTCLADGVLTEEGDIRNE